MYRVRFEGPSGPDASASSGSGGAGAMESADSERKRKFQEQRSRMDRAETVTETSLAGKRPRETDDEDRAMDAMAVNLWDVVPPG
eukprot:5394776-Amphidinium_carterae.1